MGKKLVILVGLPGSGKSTLANKIAKENDGLILSTDEFFMKDGKYLWTQDLIGEAHSWNQGLCAHLMFNDYPLIIIDNTNLNTWSIKPYINLCNKLGYEWEIVEPETDWRYNPEECAKRNTHSVPLETLIKMQKNRESIETILKNLNKVNNGR